MDPQVSTSFIPKEALTAEKRRSGGIGLLGLIALLVFLLSIAAAGGVFAYQGFLQAQITDKKLSLENAEKAFQPETVRHLQRLDNRLTQAQNLLTKHVAPSAIFSFLADRTLVNVQFNSFAYSLNPDGSAAIELDGVADSFSTVALQSDALGPAALGSTASLRDVVFADINIDQSGRVSFTMRATVDPSLIAYAKVLAATPVGAQELQQAPEEASSTEQ